MENDRFDAIARALAPATSRRKLLRWAGIAGIIGALGGVKAAQATCRHVGCGCAGGTLHSCRNDLVCCPSSPGTPGGGGTCLFPEDCFVAPEPVPCTGLGCTCNTGTFQPCEYGLECCPDSPGVPGGSGTCQWNCPSLTCTGSGCSCGYNDIWGCDDGLVCCAAQNGYFCAGFGECCRRPGESCVSGSQCCSGYCMIDDTCSS